MHEFLSQAANVGSCLKKKRGTLNWISSSPPCASSPVEGYMGEREAGRRRKKNVLSCLIGCHSSVPFSSSSSSSHHISPDMRWVGRRREGGGKRKRKMHLCHAPPPLPNLAGVCQGGRWVYYACGKPIAKKRKGRKKEYKSGWEERTDKEWVACLSGGRVFAKQLNKKVATENLHNCKVAKS